jgi:hypothetical protein
MTEDELDTLERAASWLRADAANSDSKRTAEYLDDLSYKVEDIIKKIRQKVSSG